MACATFLDSAQRTDRHLHRDPCCTPSTTTEWLSPRISFSTDFAQPPAVAAHNSYEGNEIVEKDSASDFEFSMSIQGHDSSCGSTMLPADELFYEGKLLPLYIPQHFSQPELPASRGENKDVELFHADASVDQVPANSISSRPRHASSQRKDPYPVSPKAPTCTSRWKELFGLKKMQIQDVKEVPHYKQRASPQQKPPLTSEPLHPSIKSSDEQNDSNAVSPPSDDAASSPLFSFTFSTEPSSISAMESGLSPGNPNWPMDRALSASRSSKSSDEESMEIRAKVQRETASGAAVKKRNLKTAESASRARSPVKSSELRSPGTSPRRGSRGVSPGRPSALGSRPTESSRNAIAARLVVRGLDRSYSSPKPLRKRPDQMRSGRQRGDGLRALERSTSYSASVRVAPVINVPVYISPGLRKGSKNGIFGFSQLFSSKKEKLPKQPTSNSAKAAHMDG